MRRPSKWQAKFSKVQASFRSGLEDKVAAHLEARGIPVEYEQHTLTYVVPEKEHKYTPDFRLPDGTFVETKGYFEPEDRKKHLWVRDSNPGVVIRFVFTNPHKPIRKGSKTTYAMWCEKHGFDFATKLPPDEWIKQ